MADAAAKTAQITAALFFTDDEKNRRH